MGQVIYRYRGRELTCQDIDFIKTVIAEHFSKGRSHISRILCQKWNWAQPNGKLKEYAARDLLLRLEEGDFIKLPPRIRPNNNVKAFSFDHIPLFKKQPIVGTMREYSHLTVSLVSQKDDYLWKYLLHHYHYLGTPRLVGEHLRYLVYIQDQVVACLAWASAAWRVKAREEFIKWSEPIKRKKLHYIVNNTRFCVLPWIRIKCLASKVLSLTLKRLSDDWYSIYNHPVYLAETFVDQSRFQGICYRASNWRYVGHTSGSGKRGNVYHYHGQPKAVYLYPLHRHFKRLLCDEGG